MALNAEEFLKDMKKASKSFGVSLTAATQTLNDARHYTCAVNSDARRYTCANQYDAFYGSDIKDANNELEETMDEFDKKMQEWMKRFEGSPQVSNERKIRQAMKTSPPPPPAKKGLSEELDELLGLMEESKRNLGAQTEDIWRPRESRDAYAPSKQVGSIESELNSQLMGLKGDYRKLEVKNNKLLANNDRLETENLSLRRANETLTKTVGDYKQKLFAKKKKQDMVKPVKNIFGGIVKWFTE